MHKNYKLNIRKATFWNSLGLILLVSAALQWPLPVVAKEPPANLQPLEEVPPPPVIGADENAAAEPEITIIKKQGETVEEYRINGQLYMLKVTPAHGVPYYMHKEDSNGGWLMDGPDQPLSIPKWTIFRF
jgi:hypothetical protein